MLLPLFLFLFFQQTSNEPKTATLEGTVAHAGSKVPIRKAKVNLTVIGAGANTSVETAEDGKFLLKDVKPGRYRITAERTAYETTAYGARKQGDTLGQVLRVDAGAALTGLDITLPKQGIIAGKVMDADNEPVPRVLVMATTSMYYQNGRKAQIPRGSIPVITNDLGEYRISQLPPGNYVVCAVPAGLYQPAPSDTPSKPATEESSVTTCYPNVTKMDEASKMEIKDSTELAGVDIRLTKTRTVTVQGRVVGVPQSSGSITILNLNARTAGPMGNAINPRAYVQAADGKFEFKNVPPGAYTIHTLPTGLGNTPFVVKTPVEIGDRPVTDLQISAVVPFEIKAKVTAEPSPEFKLSSIRLVLTPADEITSALAMGTANADGDLTLANIVAGRYRVAIAGAPPTHYVKELRTDQGPAEGDEVEIPAAATTLALTFAQGRGEVSGLVRNEKGEAVPGVPAVLIPNPRRAFHLRTVRTDQNGVFKLQNVPPGEYRLIAFDAVENGAVEDSEFLKPFISKMKSVKVTSAEVQNFELNVVAAAGAN